MTSIISSSLAGIVSTGIAAASAGRSILYGCSLGLAQGMIKSGLGKLYQISSNKKIISIPLKIVIEASSMIASAALVTAAGEGLEDSVSFNASLSLGLLACIARKVANVGRYKLLVTIMNQNPEAYINRELPQNLDSQRLINIEDFITWKHFFEYII